MGCLNLEIEGQSCLVGSVNQGLKKNRQIDLLDRMTKKKSQKKKNQSFFPIATLPGIFQHITPPKKLETFRPNYRLSTSIIKIVGDGCGVGGGLWWRWFW